MANWKENGVVPDSEDEDDLDLETQSDTDNDNATVHTNEQNEGHQAGENGEERGDGRTEGLSGINLDHADTHTNGKELPGHENCENREGKEVNGIHGAPGNNNRRADTPVWNENHEIGGEYGGDISEDELALTPVAKTVKRRQTGLDNGGVPASSHSQPPVFRIPSFEEDSAPLSLELLSGSQLLENSSGNDLPTEDDISTSYVRISSPNSSPLSSIPGSQDSRQRIQVTCGISNPIVLQDGVESTAGHAAITTIIEDSEVSRRSFRQRNPIQLHPYMLEQEKYRKTLKDRGVKPMRITQTQEEKESNSRNSVSPAPESQNTEVDTGGSQVMDFDWDIPSSPPTKAPVREPDDIQVEGPFPIESVSDEGSIASDDEFPDVNELLRKPKAVPNTSGPKRRLKKYSIKNRTNSLTTRPILSAHHEDNTIFDIPVSPPVTSSPSDDIPRPFRTSTETPTSSVIEQRHFRVPAGIRTPVTSAIKPPSRTIPVDSDSEGDPFANEHDIPQTIESSSDESVDHTLRRKIRGVLPASHLRLNHDSKRPDVPSATRRHSFDEVLITPQIRRGVAMPKTSTTSAQRQPGNFEIPFLSDESEDENESYAGGFVAEDDAPTALDMIFNDRQGAEEESTIDRMLPSQKRASRISSTRPKKRRRTGIDSLSRKNSNVRQPKITEHLGGAPQRQQSKLGKSKSMGVFGTRPKKSRKVAPRLSILDAVDYDDTNKPVPQFVRIAARAARSRKEQGRHSPSKKFIRMSNREDTHDVQSVLQDWRRGKIQPKNREYQRSHSNDTTRRALQQIAGNKQTKLIPSTKTTFHGTPATSTQATQPPRRLFVTKPRQTSIAGFVTPGGPISTPEPPRVQLRSPQKARFHQSRPHFNQSVARPAQLELADIDNPHRDSESFFKTSKRSLDVIFRDLRRRHGARANPQLGRFLSDPSIQPTVEIDDDDSGATSAVPAKKAVLLSSRRKKNPPTRVDVDAAEYRQPSEPIIVESLSTRFTTDKSGKKLQGLGKFGTRYPIHFDILHLNNSVYFHESSFIGSGRLSEVISGVRIQNCTDGVRNSFTLGNKVFRWDQWNETVSSEIGVCFDWAIEQACESQPVLPNTDPVSAIDFVIGYIQHHMVFQVPHDQLDFLSRMSEVFGDVLSRLDGLDGVAQGTRWLEVFTRSTIVVYQLLQMARKIPDCETLSYDLEDLLKRVATKAARLLVADGLGNLRGLYDDLQYLSFRELGLKNKQAAFQGWVILIKVLDASQILRGTFWDIVNPELSETSLHEVSDVPTFEKLWYSMFTLLPLFAFDELGIVKPGLRSHNFSDNWAMPQRILKRIFEIYTSETHQPPGFNDYCKANIARCHYLMVEWGWWKCSVLIGAIFDFFASQKLAHLRNEEVYYSPKFLTMLNTNPSLSAEREDRCFHIFLKMVGLLIKRMGHNGDVKGVRNLVTRLFPNHDRNFPKEESTSHRELASLRNHHDLLCTLYWAAPAQQRKSPTYIQDLVVADQSHNEACLINLRAWENLTRFVVSEPVDILAYHPFTNWQNSLSTALAKQYLGTEVEVRSQAESLFKAGKEPISDSLLRGTIDANKRSTMEMLRVIVRVMGHTVEAATSSQMAILAFNPAVLQTLCSQEICEDEKSSESLIGDSIAAINQFLTQIDKLEPTVAARDQNGSSGEGDSQDSDDMSLCFVRWEMIHRLQPEIVPLLRSIITKGMQESSKMRPEILFNAVTCWARLVTKMTEGAMRLKDFLVSGQNAVFQYRHSSGKAMAYWPVLLGELVEHKDLDELKMPVFDIGAQWLLAITMPSSITALSLGAVDMLTARLRSKGHYLLTGHVGIASTFFRPTSTGSQTPTSHVLFKHAIDIMRTTLLNQINVDLVLGNFSLKEAQTMFAAMLKQVMESIKNQLESLPPGSTEHLEYVNFVQPIASIIRSYASEIQPLLDFFVQSSIHYWPGDTDPTMYAAGVVAYSLRLAKDPSRTSPQLFHYLYNGWRQDLVQGRIKQHMNHVKKGMQHWEFTEFILSEFIPAALHVGFRWAGGWTLCATYLPVLSNRLIKTLQEGDEKATAASGYLIDLLKDIINELSVLHRNVVVNSSNALANHLYIAHTVFQFWLSVVLPMKVFASSQSNTSKTVDDIETSMMNLMSQACQIQDRESVHSLEIPTSQVTRGVQFNKFVEVLTQDLNQYWEVANNGYEVEIGSTRARDNTKTRLDLAHLLGEPLTLKQLLGRSLLVMPFLADVPGVVLPVGGMKGPMVKDIFL